MFFKIILYHEEEFVFSLPSCLVGRGLEPPKPSCQIPSYFTVLKTDGELQVGEVIGKNGRRNVACIGGKRSEFLLQQIDTACSNVLLGLAQGNICRNTDINKCS